MAFFLITAIIFTIHHLIRDDIFKWRYSLFIFAFAFASSTTSLFRSGQLNGLILFLLILNLVFLTKKKEAASGVCLAIATTLKIFPIIFLPYLLITKRWYAAFSMIITSMLVWLASIPFFGISATIKFLKNTLPYLLMGNIGYIAESTSLFGSFRMGVKHGELDWLHLSRKTIVSIGENVYIAVTFFALVAVFYLLWRHRHSQKNKDLLLHYSLLIIFVLLFSKSIHSAYHLWIVPTILLLLCQPLAVSAKYKAATYQYVFAIIILLFTNFWHVTPFKLQTTLALWKPTTLSLFLLFLFVLLANTKRLQKFLQIYSDTQQ